MLLCKCLCLSSTRIKDLLTYLLTYTYLLIVYCRTTWSEAQDLPLYSVVQFTLIVAQEFMPHKLTIRILEW